MLDSVDRTVTLSQLGGDAVAASYVLARVNALFEVEIELKEVLGTFCVADVADLVQTKLADKLDNMTEAEVVRAVKRGE